MRELVRPERTVRQKQRSERPKAVVAAVESAVETFLRSGRIIARENPDNQQELLDYVAVAEVEEAGQNLIRQSSHFALSPLKAARTLLSSVTKLLLMADYVDVMRMVRRAEEAERSLRERRSGKTSREVARRVRDLLERTNRREEDLLDPGDSNLLGEARERLRRVTAEQRSDWSQQESEKEDPLDRIISAAEAGHEAAVTRYSQIFTEHALKLLEVADLTCRMEEEREEGVAKVREAVSVLECLYRQASESKSCKYSQC